jgi:hypothetical protein
VSACAVRHCCARIRRASKHIWSASDRAYGLSDGDLAKGRRRAEGRPLPQSRCAPLARATRPRTPLKGLQGEPQADDQGGSGLAARMARLLSELGHDMHTSTLGAPSLRD